MICHRCLRAAAAISRPSSIRTAISVAESSRIPSLSLQSDVSRLNSLRRGFSTSFTHAAEAISPAAATQAKGRQGPDGAGPSSATSTSAAQPFSTPLTPSPAAQGIKGTPAKSSAPAIPVSSVPAGTPLKGLAFLKNQPDPIAKEDSEYPAWLWKCLAEKEAANEKEAEVGDLYSKSRKQRRLAAKRLRKLALLNPESLAPKVPLQEQSIDLPAGDGTAQGAIEAKFSRDELTKAMRTKRRSLIKEDNFLRGMR
ncbi:hypothetical protein L228DRAFT_260497 [Xylona heveae TC161]|uniref:Large ribosomal subunit protein mL54 n=1 Tax=Xylona heveae (strain CBS 132557 / TC161) TaxID=1328760 RepID=A0A165HMA3_XYLHT|nr:hypothetical protein L228DRAFT_260497 [Xylona heveae TC161]KZF23726.1 hypothetical protein L228DRAFT_260497 [Xylona heveae TC161]